MDLILNFFLFFTEVLVQVAINNHRFFIRNLFSFSIPPLLLPVDSHSAKTFVFLFLRVRGCQFFECVFSDVFVLNETAQLLTSSGPDKDALSTTCPFLPHPLTRCPRFPFDVTTRLDTAVLYKYSYYFRMLFCLYSGVSPPHTKFILLDFLFQEMGSASPEFVLIDSESPLAYVVPPPQLPAESSRTPLLGSKGRGPTAVFFLKRARPTLFFSAPSFPIDLFIN